MKKQLGAVSKDSIAGGKDFKDGASSSSSFFISLRVVTPRIEKLIDVAQHESSEEIEDLVTQMTPQEIQAAFIELAKEQSEGGPDGTEYGDLASTAMQDLMPYMSIAGICIVSRVATPEELTEMVRIFSQFNEVEDWSI